MLSKKTRGSFGEKKKKQGWAVYSRPDRVGDFLDPRGEKNALREFWG